MDRKLFGVFSGTHITIMALGAMFVPGALYAIPSFTNVAIEDPSTGSRAAVDSDQRLSVYDPVAGLANYPKNYVRIYSECSGGNNPNVYAPPQGKAFIIKSVGFHFSKGKPGADNFDYIYNGASVVAAIESGEAFGSQSNELGNGSFVRAGELIYSSCAANGTYGVSITGYLVPGRDVPNIRHGEEAAQSVGAFGQDGGHR